MLVHVFVFKFGIDNGLAVVQAVVAGQHIAGGYGNEKIISIVKAEQLEGNEQGGDRAVGNSAEYGDHANSSAQGRGKAQKRSHGTAEGGADKQGGYDFTALVAGGYGNDRKEHFKEKGPRERGAGQGVFNDGHAGAQVVLALCEKGQEDEQAASGSNTDIEVGKICFKYPFPHLKHHTEQNAQYGAAGSQKHYLQAGDKGKLQIIHDVEIFRLHAREFGDIVGNQGGTDAGNQGGVIHNSHTGYLHGKKGGRHRGAEQRGKSGSHAAHQNDFLVCFIKMEEVAQLFAHTSADLKGRALPSHGTAAEDGDYGGTEDEESHAEGNDDLAVDAFDD